MIVIGFLSVFYDFLKKQKSIWEDEQNEVDKRMIELMNSANNTGKKKDNFGEPKKKKKRIEKKTIEATDTIYCEYAAQLQIHLFLKV